MLISSQIIGGIEAESHIAMRTMTGIDLCDCLIELVNDGLFLLRCHALLGRFGDMSGRLRYRV